MAIPTWISSLVNDAVIAAGADAILMALRSIIETFRQGRFDGIYTSAEDFWYRGIEHDQLSDGAKVRVRGLLSPFAPYMPSNPRAKPGYSAQGWSDFSKQLSDFLHVKHPSSPADPLSASGYDVLDVFVWGDLVYRPRQSLAGRKLYAGLYNQYGKSFECVPVFLDESIKNQRSALDKIGWPKNMGNLVELSGEIRRMSSYYATIGLAKPNEPPGMPCFCIEASSIQVLTSTTSVLYITSWCSFGSLERRNLVTEFFDAKNPDERKSGLGRLRIRTPKKNVYFYYDSLEHPYERYPKGNEDLDDRLRKG
jgi:hypothetical protein